MRTLSQLFENNRRWAHQMTTGDPEFFRSLAGQQAPHYLWIGCSDARVPANEIVGLPPGELFVHRNVANVVSHTDFNCLSVIQYSIEVLRIRHIIVCGHDGCGGVRAAMEEHELGLIDNWLRHVRDVFTAHHEALQRIPDDAARLDRLCELNVRAQVRNVCDTTIVQAAWRAGRRLSVHGWIYGLHDGLLRDLDVTVTGGA
ncbi:MAG TPA: carbonate dehydratase [Gemmatimonadales bacterium]|jgi:carbonic anhydrase|nr:carbonate dehydratase [Gemmatimonadales bacterium]